MRFEDIHGMMRRLFERKNKNNPYPVGSQLHNDWLAGMHDPSDDVIDVECRVVSTPLWVVWDIAQQNEEAARGGEQQNCAESK